MESYFEVVRISLLLFPLIALLMLVPYVLVQYMKHGYVQLNRAFVFYLFLFYAATAFFMTILPLPELTENFCAIRAGKLDPSFTAFRFISDMSKELHGNFSLHGILKSRIFMVTIFNVLLLMPLGFFLRYLFGIRHLMVAVLIGFFSSLFFELTQLTGLYGLYPCAFRLFEVDDLITNTTGAVLGFVIAKHVHILPSISEQPMPYKNKISFAQRFLAFFLDMVFISIVSAISINFIQEKLLLADIFRMLLLLIYFIVIPYYWNGQTLGKKILGLKIVSNTGAAPSFGQLLKRYGLLILLPVGIGMISNYEIEHSYYNGIYAIAYFGIMFVLFLGVFLIPLIKRTKKGWHDTWAGTDQLKIT